MTETARLADYVLPTPVGYEKWEIAAFPRGVPEIYMQVRPPVVPAPPRRAARARDLRAARARRWTSSAPPPAELVALAHDALTPDGAMAFLGDRAGRARPAARTRCSFWAYRTLGPHLPAPALAGDLSSSRT